MSYIYRVLHTLQFTAMRHCATRRSASDYVAPGGHGSLGDSEVVILRCFLLKPWPLVPGLVNIQKTIENGPFIVDLPIKKKAIFHIMG